MPSTPYPHPEERPAGASRPIASLKKGVKPIGCRVGTPRPRSPITHRIPRFAAAQYHPLPIFAPSISA